MKRYKYTDMDREDIHANMPIVVVVVVVVVVTKLLYDLWSVSQPAYLGVEATLGLVTSYYFLSEGCCLKFAVLFPWGALSDERTRLQFAVQSLNGPSRAETVTIRHCPI
jgi:hypothetical protein